MNDSMTDHQTWMREALACAGEAALADEVPVGAVVVKDGEVIGRGWNQPISGCDPTAHAEVVALRAAAKRMNNYRLSDCTLYVTIEPCTMCAGAIIHSRVKRVVYGCTEPKAGAVESNDTLLAGEHLNHRVEVIGGVLAEACSQTISDFFSRRRAEKKAARAKSEQTGAGN